MDFACLALAAEGRGTRGTRSVHFQSLSHIPYFLAQCNAASAEEGRAAGGPTRVQGLLFCLLPVPVVTSCPHFFPVLAYLHAGCAGIKLTKNVPYQAGEASST